MVSLGAADAKHTNKVIIGSAILRNALISGKDFLFSITFSSDLEQGAVSDGTGDVHISGR
jgi:hypothetical protein